MKKEEKIFDAITNIDDEIIEEAKNIEPRKKYNKWIRNGFIAASFLFVLGIGIFLSSNKESPTDIRPLLAVNYPKAYAFDDYETRFAVREENPIDNNLISIINNFAYETSSIILSQETDNINYSPISLYYALSLATSGADGQTSKELLDLLGVSDINFLSEQLANLYNLLYFENDIGQLKIANSIWMSNDFRGQAVEFKDSYVENAAKNFYASSYELDFEDENTPKAMAEWISTNTNGTISPNIELSDDQILSIINTIYFYDEWVDKFDEKNTAKDTFYLLDKSKVDVDFMNTIKSSQIFYKGENYTRSILNLKNAGGMVFILPDEGISPYDLIDSSDKVKEVFEDGKEAIGEVVWKIPKFEFASTLKLKDSLQKLGVSDAFSDKADFSRMTDNFAFISDVIQESHISIDERGVEASAYTKIDYDGSALPVDKAYMILDRPFIYGITASNGTLLFLGVCDNPK
ncbi:MAG: serpin family protein [Clostridiales bacterium]|nr:serpin family protein [Clostridiales bacterium]